MTVREERNEGLKRVREGSGGLTERTGSSLSCWQILGLLLSVRGDLWLDVHPGR